jgi:Pyridoxamine 5'-phosphate oxidase
MGRTYDALTDDLSGWLLDQRVFFVATAPLAADGHVNLSPKGHDCFRVLSPTCVAYLDLTGSGAETIAHLRENGRITLLFTAFDGPPRIVRLHGQGSVVTAGDNRWDALSSRFPKMPGTRSVIVVDVTRIATSCGYSVPLLAYAGERPTLLEWAERKGPDGLDSYRSEKNATSIDGLPALGPAC